MEEATIERDPGVIGREPELAVLREFLDGSSQRALVLTGGPGIGKTTLWEAGIDAAHERGMRVLSTRATGAEAQLSFGGLIDLLDEVTGEELAGLPAPQHRALAVALLRAEPGRAAPESGAIAFGFLNALRALSPAGPVLVAVDDVQWLDSPSAEALAFAVHRLDFDAARFLLTKRPGRPSSLERAFDPAPLQQLAVAPLSLGATRRLLSDRLGLTLTRQLLRQLVESTMGNPMFALEVGRTLAERGLPTLGEGLPLPDTVEDLLGTRVTRLRAPVRRLLLAVALSAELRVGQLAQLADVAAVDDALDAGLLLVEGERVRASHPLLATAARKHSRPRARRELHRELARLVADEELRARHLALAADSPDEGLAATVAGAAAAGFARGARQDAVELGTHALRLTPPESEERADRLLALAGYLEVGGEPERVLELLSPEIESFSTAASRVRALLQLTECAMRTNGTYQRYLDRALAESGSDPVLRAQVLPAMAMLTRIRLIERIDEAEAWALEALAAARHAGPDVERLALEALGWSRSLRGKQIEDVSERLLAVSDVAPHIADSLERVVGQRLVWRGEVDRARSLLAPLLTLADERGESYSYALLRVQMCELELRCGDSTAAARLLDEWAESSERDLLPWTTYERCHALLAAGRGDADEAERSAANVISGADETGSRWSLLEALRARGIAALLTREPARAAESLRAVWAHTEREGVDEPGAFPVAPDLVEALVELDELDEARAVTDRLSELADVQEHPWGLATARRCDALLRLRADADGDAATAELERTATAYRALGLRFDVARTLLVLGRLQRRRRKWAAARNALEQAATAFEGTGSPGWAEDARSELARVGGRRAAAAGELTPSERRVAELAADGLANKEIARALHVSVHTVEVHLSSVYAKLGVRTRGRLAARLVRS